MCDKSIMSQVGRLCTILLTIVGFSATSRRGPPTSRRQNHMLLSRRDVYFHVATCIFTSRRQLVHASVTSRRQLVHASVTSRSGFTRRDVKFISLCHVATWNSHVATSLLHFSVTSRRRFTRRDVDWYKSLSRRDVAPNVATSFGHVLCHVATLTQTSRRWLVYSLPRHDVTPHVATWPCFKPKIGSFLVLHLTHSI